MDPRFVLGATFTRIQLTDLNYQRHVLWCAEDAQQNIQQ